MHFHKPRGFTLIELLVVISIISLLSSVILASVNDARAKARDTKRLEDLRQINTALQLYLQDHNTAPTPGNSPHSNYNSADAASWSAFGSVLTGYITRLPLDPLNGQTIPVDKRANFTLASTYRYLYRRMDSQSDSCPGHPGCKLLDAYILDTTFEKRAKGSYPVTSLFGVPYPDFNN